MPTITNFGDVITQGNTITQGTGFSSFAGSLNAPTFYGAIAGSNTIAASTISGTTVSATSVVGSTALYGAIAGSNTIAASTISGTTVSATTLSGAGSGITSLDMGNAGSGTLAVARGGTSATSASAAFNALSPMSAAGDLIYGGVSGAGTRLPAGTATQILHSGTTPTWGSVSLTADVSGTLPVGNGGTGLTSTSQYFVFAGPTTGSGAPSFRALASGDIPNNAANTSGSAASLSATLAVGSGGTGVTSSTGTGSVVLSSNPTLTGTVTAGTFSGSAASLTSFPTLNQNTSGTAAGLTGTPNISVGTVGASTITGSADASFNSVKVGRGAGSVSTNTAVGSGALNVNSTGYRNTAVGNDALKAMNTGNDNTAVGTEALVSCVTSGLDTGNTNTAVGAGAANRTTTGKSNTVIGGYGLFFNTTSSQNTAIGYFAMYYNQAAGISDGYTNSTCLGYDSRVSGSNQVQAGNSTTAFYAYGAYNNRSDIRDKADVRDTVVGLEFINKVRAVDFRWNYREDYFEKVEEDVTDPETGAVTKVHKLIPIPNDGSKKRTRFHQGVIAQQVKEAMDELGVDFAGYQDHTLKGGCDVLTIGYTEFVAPLIKAVQELSVKNTTLEQSLAIATENISLLKTQMASMEQRLATLETRA